MSAAATNVPSSLGALEWKVVEVARRDRGRDIDPDSFLARIAHILLGTPLASRLADSRLEALRRFCIRAWHGGTVRTDDVRRLIEAGYSVGDLSRILAHVCSRPAELARG